MLKFCRDRLLSILSAAWLVAAEADESNVPGCNCAGTVCNDANRSNVQACRFLYQSPSLPSLYGDDGDDGDLSYIRNETEPICNALDADPNFVETYGPGALLPGRPSYYNSGEVSIYVYNSTCAQAYELQNSCRISDIFGADSGVVGAMGGTIYPSKIESCYVVTFLGSLRMRTSCLSYYNESITAGYEDSFVIFAEPREGGVGSLHLCDKDTPAKYPPILTSADWVEPIEGRRYMCYDFMDEGNPYSIMAMSIGNPPCSGPEPSPSGVGMLDLSWYWLCGSVVATFYAAFVV